MDPGLPAKDSGEATGEARATRPGWIALPLAAVLLVFARLHAFPLPLEPDECNYVYIGQRLLAGDRLYVDVWDHQPPGVFALFAGVIALAGAETSVFRFMAIGFSLASLAHIYLIVRRAVGGFMAGAAALAFALLSSDPGTAGEGCNREIYMNLFVLAGVALLSGATSRRDGAHGEGVPRDAQPAPLGSRAGRSILLAGLMLGIASAFKTVVAVQWLFLVAWLVGSTWRTTRSKREVVQAVTAFGAGPLVIWLLAFGYFGSTGRLGDFVEAVFRYNIDYAGAKTSLLGRFEAFFVEGWRRDIFTSAAPLWITGAIAVIGVALIGLRNAIAVSSGNSTSTTEVSGRRGLPARRPGLARALPARVPDRGLEAAPTGHSELLIVAYALGSFIAVCSPGHSWPHYYYLLVPPLLIAVPTFFGLAARTRLPHRFSMYPLASRGHARHGGSSTWRIAAVVWVVLIGRWQVRDYLTVPALKITDTRYDSIDLWGCAQGRNVAEVTDPDDTVLVVGAHPGIYFYSGRRAATRYTMMAGMQEDYPGFVERRRTCMADIQRQLPRVILVLPDGLFPELDAFIRANYLPAGPQWIDYHDRRVTEPIMFAMMDARRPVRPIDWNWHRTFVQTR